MAVRAVVRHGQPAHRLRPGGDPVGHRSPAGFAGRSRLVVGVVTGADEAAALALPLVYGPLADRTPRFWGLAIAGYALTVVSVPLLAFAVHEAMDQVGALVGPLLVAGVLALTGGQYGPALGVLAVPGVAVAGSLMWGAAMGIQESTLRATVADLVPSGRRATAYGLFAGVVGVASLAGGALTGGLYGYSIPVLITAVVAVQILAIVLLATTRATRR